MYRQSEKNVLSSNISSTCPHNMVNFGPLAAEIVSLVWGTPPNFNGFGVLAALLHGILVVGVSQTLRRWTEGATYIRQGDHHVGHWPTFYLFKMRVGFSPTTGKIKLVTMATSRLMWRYKKIATSTVTVSLCAQTRWNCSRLSSRPSSPNFPSLSL